MSNEQPTNRHDESVGDVRAGQSSYSDEDWRQRLEALLSAQGVEGRITEVRRPTVGASAASAIFSVERVEDGRTVERRYVARLKPESSFFSMFDVVEQFTVQRYLHQAGCPVPAPLWLDADGQHLGRPGYVMEFATGVPSSPAYFVDGPLAGASTEQRFRMLRNMTVTLAEFHRKTAPAGLPGLANKGRGGSWIEREINMWFDLVGYVRPELVQFYEPICRWLIATAPEVPDPVVVHGDYQVSNVLWTGEEVSSVLDFEAVRIGPRESDVAYQCNFDEVAAKFFCGLDIELPSLAQRAAWYEEAVGVRLVHLDYHYLRAVFQLACGVASLARNVEQDLALEPTPFMDFINRRLLEVLPKSLPFEPRLPLIGRPMSA